MASLTLTPPNKIGKHAIGARARRHILREFYLNFPEDCLLKIALDRDEPKVAYVYPS